MKTRIVIILVVLLAGIAAVTSSKWFVQNSSKYHNSFNRIFPPHAISDGQRILLPTGRVSLLGFNGREIMLDHRTDEVNFISLDSMLTSRFLDLKLNVSETGQNPITYFNGYSLFIQNVQTGQLLRLNSDLSAVDSITQIQPFATGLNIEEQSQIVYQTVDVNKSKNVLSRIRSKETKAFVLPRQVDGIFCTDGFLLFSHSQEKYIYIFRYRNEVIFLDKDLDYLVSAKTIDTVRIAKISVVEISGKIVMSKPPLQVNRTVAVDGNFLFVNSGLMAKNEDQPNFDRNSVIDVYDLGDRTAYKFSFYIPNVDNRRFTSFRVQGNKLVVLFPNNTLVVYRLTEKYFR